MDEQEWVAKYRLAYVNFSLCQKDNGRVLGFDMAHGFHHEHRMGRVTEVVFENFEALEVRFEKEFRAYHEQARNK